MPIETIDHELDVMEDSLRRLKIEYDIYFVGGAKRPPTSSETRFNGMLRLMSENGRLNLAQRYRFSAICQRYSVFGDLWRRKLRIKDEGYRRPEEKLLGVHSGRIEELKDERATAGAFEPESFLLFTEDAFEVVALYEAVVRAREAAGKPLGDFSSFAGFVQKKSSEIRHQYHCEVVEYTVLLKDGQVQLKARARKDVRI